MKGAFDAPTPPHQLIGLWHLMRSLRLDTSAPISKEEATRNQDGCERHRSAQPRVPGEGNSAGFQQPRVWKSVRELQILIKKCKLWHLLMTAHEKVPYKKPG